MVPMSPNRQLLWRREGEAHLALVAGLGGALAAPLAACLEHIALAHRDGGLHGSATARRRELGVAEPLCSEAVLLAWVPMLGASTAGDLRDLGMRRLDSIATCASCCSNKCLPIPATG